MNIGYPILIALLLTACADPTEIAPKLIDGPYVFVPSDGKPGAASLCPKATIDKLSNAAKKGDVLKCPDAEVKIISKDQVEQKLGFFERQAAQSCTPVACGNGTTKYREWWLGCPSC